MQPADRATRSWPRLAPKRSATAAVFQRDNRLAYGVLTNVSEHGACIITDSFLPAGARVDLRLSFYERPDIFEAESRIVWNRRGSEALDSANNFLLHGFEFMSIVGEHRGYLDSLLGSTEFQVVSESEATEFDNMRRDLRDVLDELGNQISKRLGDDSEP